MPASASPNWSLSTSPSELGRLVGPEISVKRADYWNAPALFPPHRTAAPAGILTGCFFVGRLAETYRNLHICFLWKQKLHLSPSAAAAPRRTPSHPEVEQRRVEVEEVEVGGGGITGAHPRTKPPFCPRAAGVRTAKITAASSSPPLPTCTRRARERGRGGAGVRPR